MPRPRKYEYGKNKPETMFFRVPEDLKREVEALYSNKERNALFEEFLRKHLLGRSHLKDLEDED